MIGKSLAKTITTNFMKLSEKSVLFNTHYATYFDKSFKNSFERVNQLMNFVKSELLHSGWVAGAQGLHKSFLAREARPRTNFNYPPKLE